MLEDEKQIIGYKIMPGKKIRIFKHEREGRPYYNTQISQKNMDGTYTSYYRTLIFKKGVVLEDHTGHGIDIIINRGFESLMPLSGNPSVPISSIVVTDFELIETKDEMETKAFKKYGDAMTENEIDDSELAF